MLSLRKIIVWAAPLIVALFVGQTHAQSAPMIPGGLSGTYQMTYSGSTHSTFPFKAADKVTFVLNANKPSICVNGTEITYGAMLTVSDVRFVASPIQYILKIAGNSLTEISVYRDFKSLLHNPETYLGKFTGTRTSTSTDCTGAAPSLSTQEDTLLSLAQDLYPSVFSNGSALGSIQGYVYKHFPASGVYVGFKDGRLYLLGGQFGSALSDMGTVAAAVTALQAEKTNQANSIPPGVQWVFNGISRSDSKGALTITPTGYQTGSGKGLSVVLLGGSVFFQGVRWNLGIVSPTASPVVIPKGKYSCSLTSGAMAQVLVRDDNFQTTFNGGCYIDFAKDLSAGQPAVGTFRVESGTTVVTGRLQRHPLILAAPAPHLYPVGAGLPAISFVLIPKIACKAGSHRAGSYSNLASTVAEQVIASAVRSTPTKASALSSSPFPRLLQNRIKRQVADATGKPFLDSDLQASYFFTAPRLLISSG